MKARIVPFRLLFKPKSHVVWGSSNPLFKSYFKLRLSENKLKSGNLIITIWGKRKVGKSKFIGEVIIPILATTKVANNEYQNYNIKLNEVFFNKLCHW